VHPSDRRSIHVYAGALVALLACIETRQALAVGLFDAPTMFVSQSALQVPARGVSFTGAF
jgi:hypothetical protein